MTDPMRWSLKEALAAIQRRDISCTELVSASLKMSATVQARLNCFINIDEEQALAQARTIDNKTSLSGLALAGIPLAHKDMYYREGKVSTCGSESRGNVPSRETAAVLENLDNAGAVDIGTLNMAEFAFGATGHNHHFGACRNAWNPDHIAGGSSSGSGAAVAAGAVFGALGSDTGGSIRIPAAVGGIVGLKPTQGLVSTRGMMPMSPSMDCAGPLARTAEDIGLLMDSLAPRALAAGQSFNDLNTSSPRGLRIGIPQNYYYDKIDPEVNALLQQSLKRYEELGCELVPVTVPDHDVLINLAYIVLGAETAAHHAQNLKAHADQYGPQTRARLLAGYFLPATAYAQARMLRAELARRFIEQVYSKCDVLHAPVLRQPVPTLEETSLVNDARMVAMITDLSYCTRLTNYLGVPAISVPCGFTSDGLPVGFQLIGKPFAEQQLIAFAHWHENASGYRNQIAPNGQAVSA